MSRPTSNPTAITKQRADSPSTFRFASVLFGRRGDEHQQPVECLLAIANTGDELDELIRLARRQIQSAHRRTKRPEQPNNRRDRRRTNRHVTFERI